jgi:hypothetical protein
MKRACLVVNGYLKSNVIFRPDQHRDNWADRFFKLRQAFADNIQNYLNSSSAYQFRSEGFVQTIVETIFNDQGENKS